MAKAKEIQVKTETVKEQAKEIKLDFWKAIQERREVALRENNAREYIRKVNRRKEQKRQARENAITNVVCIFIILVGLLFACAKGSATQSSIYAMQGELQGNHVVLEDGNAHEVSKEYANYTSESKQVTVVLNDNGTEDVTDDIIIDIR